MRGALREVAGCLGHPRVRTHRSRPGPWFDGGTASRGSVPVGSRPRWGRGGARQRGRMPSAGQAGAATRDTVTGPSSVPCPASTASASAAESERTTPRPVGPAERQRVGVGVDRVGREDLAPPGRGAGRPPRGRPELPTPGARRSTEAGSAATTWRATRPARQAVDGAAGHEPGRRERLPGGRGTHRPGGRRHPEAPSSAPGWATSCRHVVDPQVGGGQHGTGGHGRAASSTVTVGGGGGRTSRTTSARPRRTASAADRSRRSTPDASAPGARPRDGGERAGAGGTWPRR